SPVLNWMMVFVGDPLYAPRIFERSPAPPEATPSLTFSAQQNGDTYSGPLTLSAEVSQEVAGVQFQADGYDVGPELTAPPYSATALLSTLANSQCSITGSSVSVTSSSITIKATFTFTAGFAGQKSIWAAWYRDGELQAQWPIIGSWTVQ